MDFDEFDENEKGETWYLTEGEIKGLWLRFWTYFQIFLGELESTRLVLAMYNL